MDTSSLFGTIDNIHICYIQSLIIHSLLLMFNFIPLYLMLCVSFCVHSHLFLVYGE